MLIILDKCYGIQRYDVLCCSSLLRCKACVIDQCMSDYVHYQVLSISAWQWNLTPLATDADNSQGIIFKDNQNPQTTIVILIGLQWFLGTLNPNLACIASVFLPKSIRFSMHSPHRRVFKAIMFSGGIAPVYRRAVLQRFLFGSLQNLQ